MLLMKNSFPCSKYLQLYIFFAQCLSISSNTPLSRCNCICYQKNTYQSNHDTTPGHGLPSTSSPPAGHHNFCPQQSFLQLLRLLYLQQMILQNRTVTSLVLFPMLSRPLLSHHIENPMEST
jgi:hypothetical protein